MSTNHDLADLRRRARLLHNVVETARGWVRAKQTREGCALADAEARLTRAVRALGECGPAERRRGRGW
jgi:hypothetical protein